MYVMVVCIFFFGKDALITNLRLPGVTSTPLPGKSPVSGAISQARDIL